MSARSAEIQSSMQPAGPVAAVTHEMTWVLVIGAAIVFAIVMLALGLALRQALRRRAKPGASEASAAHAVDQADQARQAPQAHQAHRALQAHQARWWIGGAGIAFPLAVLLPLLVYATLRTNALTPDRAGPASDELVVTVKARLWWWEVTYRDPSRGIEVMSANQIELPVGRPVTLALISDDVIHSFWVPPLAGKVDMVPGKVHQLRLQADQPGVYRGQCAEFCGEQHARMAIHVVARPAEDFDRWLLGQSMPASVPADASEAARGRAVFEERRCSACHSVRGLGAETRIGPDLTHLGERLHLGAGTLPMSRESLAEWIAHTQRVKPGVRMPSYDLDDDSMRALVAFLEQLR